MSARTKWLGFFGLFFLIAAALWLPFGAPRLQKLPSGINDSLHYSGTVVMNVDPATGAPLAKPMTVPLSVDRHLVSLKTGATTSSLKETLTIKMGAKTETKVTTGVLDRSSMKIEGRSDAYWINLPFGMSSTKTYDMWKPETNTTYPLVRADGARVTKVDGLSLNRMTGTMPATVVSDDEARWMAAQGMPMQLSSQQVADRLTAAGIDLVATRAALEKVLTPQQMSQVLVAMTSPLPLKYTLSSSGSALIEHRTGMIVSVTGIKESLAVRPDFSKASGLVTLLQSRANVPEIAKLLKTLGAMQAAPAQPVYTLDYSQTPASISERVGAAKDAVRLLGIVRGAVPGGLAVIGVLFIGAAAFTNRRTVPPTAVPQRIGRPEAEPEIRKAA